MGRDDTFAPTPNHIRVSIHAPAWGATKKMNGNVDTALVSIHAPAWGATYAEALRAINDTGFNPRARVGRDYFARRLESRGHQFQSTRPRGARLSLLVLSVSAWGFQSTRPRGARHHRLHSLRSFLNVSIHAPAWGATRVERFFRSLQVCFNPRARVGRDALSGFFCAIFESFQSTRPRGARQL